MRLSDTERDRRWSSLRQLMAQEQIDVVLAEGTPHAVGNFRYLTSWAPFSPPPASAFALLFPTGPAELVVGGVPAQYWSRRASWVEQPTLAVDVVGETINRFRARGVKRLGVAGLPFMNCSWRDRINAGLPGVELVDVSKPLLNLRLVKSEEELRVVHRSAEIVDEVWRMTADIFAVGRCEHEVLADLEQAFRARGCEQTFNLLMPLPDAEFDRFPSNRVIRAGDAFLLELSPRYGGYWTQLTTVISMGEADPLLRKAYDTSVRARQHSLELLKPGKDALDVARAMEEIAAVGGYGFLSETAGHFAGLDLVDARVNTRESVPLKAGMAVILHAGFGADSYPLLLSADTYVVTEQGYRQLTHCPEAIAEFPVR